MVLQGESLEGRCRFALMPGSSLHLAWVFFTLVVALYTSLMTPLQRAFWDHLRSSAGRCALGILANAALAANVAVSFRTGFASAGVIIFSPAAIASRYMKSAAFVLDLLACFPDELFLIGSGHLRLGVAADTDTTYVTSSSFLLQLVKVPCSCSSPSVASICSRETRSSTRASSVSSECSWASSSPAGRAASGG